MEDTKTTPTKSVFDLDKIKLENFELYLRLSELRAKNDDLLSQLQQAQKELAVVKAQLSTQERILELLQSGIRDDWTVYRADDPTTWPANHCGPYEVSCDFDGRLVTFLAAEFVAGARYHQKWRSVYKSQIITNVIQWRYLVLSQPALGCPGCTVINYTKV